MGVRRRDLISYASADRSARGTVKSLEQNTTLSNELYVHNNIFLFHFDIQMKKASGLQIEEGGEKGYKNKNCSKQGARINSLH